MTTASLPFLPETSTAAAKVHGAELRSSGGLGVWGDGHFDLAAEHFGYIHGAALATRDSEVLALRDFLREKVGDWTVQASEYDRLAHAARALRSAVKRALSPAFYGALDHECAAIDAILSPNAASETAPPKKTL